MAETFTMFGKIGDVVSVLSADDGRDLLWAICRYGFYGEQVDLPTHLLPVFVALKEDVDNSKEMRRAGARGGRPRKPPQKPSTEDLETGVSEDPETGFKGGFRGGFKGTAETEKGGFQKTETQTKPNQSISIRSKPNQEGSAQSAPRFKPPTAEDVRQYCIEQQIYVDPNQFVDHFQANGWKIGGKTPMKDWRAAVHNWARRQTEFDQHRGGGAHAPAHDVYSLL